MLVAREHSAVELQLLKLAEEASELSAAIMRVVNVSPWSRDEDELFAEFLGEVIDVELMLEQVKVYFDDKLFEPIIKAKLERYEQRLREHLLEAE
jgi:hypothetical protein